MSEDNKITVVMPTYNDEKSIIVAIESIVKQKYTNWELLISNDGSKDNTEEIVLKYIKEKKLEDKIKYFKFENGDQLNAILNVEKYITGDLVYILHSDDLMYDELVFEKANNYFKKNKNVDAIISNAQKVNDNLEEMDIQKTKKYINNIKVLPLTLLWLGRNMYIDMAFFKKEKFLNEVKKSYLIWNIPFWMDIDKYKILNIETVDFIFFRYRIFEGNYINHESGQISVILGELRTALSLMKKYTILLYKLQYNAFRLLNKLNIKYYPIYFEKETKDKYKIAKYIVNKRFTDEQIKNNIYLYSLLTFLQKLDNIEKTKIDKEISINNINVNEYIYYGKDVRKFFNDLKNNKVSKIYIKILKLMQEGFNIININTNEEKEIIETVLKFYGIHKFVKIEIKNKE